MESWEGDRKELSDFNICLGIEEVREHEEETCSFGNPGSLQMDVQHELASRPGSVPSLGF